MKAPTGSFGGDLSLIGLFDLGQLLMLNRATGCVAIQFEEKKGYLYFQDGRLVNAVDENYAEGEGAAHRIFAWKSGTFEFRPEAPSGNAMIQTNTEALMLEAARRIDEQQQPQGPAVSSEAQRLIDRQSAMEELREAFDRVANEARHRSLEMGGSTPIAKLYALTNPGDRLVYRPGQLIRMRQREEWTEGPHEALTPTAYQDVRTRLLEVCVPILDEIRAKATRHIYLADGRVIAMDIVNEGVDEAIWLRPAEIPSPSPGRLEGDLQLLEEIVGLAPALVLIGGPDLAAARQLLHAVLATWAVRHEDTVLLATSDVTYKCQEVGGVVLKIDPRRLAAALRTIQPDVVALDPGIAPGEVNLEDLEPVPRVLAGAVGPDAASLVPRWLARLARRASQRALASLATTPMALVVAKNAYHDEAPIAMSAWKLNDEERALALRGDTATLASLLEQARSRKPRLRLHRT